MNHLSAFSSGRAGRQRGVILVVALVMLLIMTGVGITVMSGATLQERLAGNNRQLATARINAESALRRGEQYLQELGIATGDDLLALYINSEEAGHYYPMVPVGTYLEKKSAGFEITDGEEWGSDNSREAALKDSALTARQPRFMLEYLGLYNEEGGKLYSLDQQDKYQVDQYPFVFRVTAIGYGNNENIYAILQSTWMTRQGNE